MNHQAERAKGDSSPGADFIFACVSSLHSGLNPTIYGRAPILCNHARSVSAHGLVQEQAWVDVDAFETLVTAGNRAASNQAAIRSYQAAIELCAGDYLPERCYEDWTSAERERLQVLALGTMVTLADLLVETNPLESLRLTRRALATDPVWEDAYRVQMCAYLAQGNRPLALRTYQRCVEVLEREFDVEPLPEIRGLYHHIMRKSKVAVCRKESTCPCSLAPLVSSIHPLPNLRACPFSRVGPTHWGESR